MQFYYTQLLFMCVFSFLYWSKEFIWFEFNLFEAEFEQIMFRILSDSRMECKVANLNYSFYFNVVSLLIIVF